MVSDRDYVLAQLGRRRHAAADTSPALWGQIGLIDYAIHATLKAGREPEWRIYAERLSRLCEPREVARHPPAAGGRAGGAGEEQASGRTPG